jgi:membrane-bound ClpP family serine protease
MPEMRHSMNLLFDPNVAYLLLVTGLIVAILALFAPGTGVLEIGALFMLFLAGYGIINQQVNPWALAVLILGVFPFLLALRKSRQYVFLGLSILALVVGSVFLVRAPAGGSAVNPVLAILVSVLATVFLWFVGRRGIEAIQRPVTHNLDRLIGMVGQAHTNLNPDGSVYVGSEEWSAHCDTFVSSGSRVRVLRRDGLILTVEPLASSMSTKEG